MYVWVTHLVQHQLDVKLKAELEQLLCLFPADLGDGTIGYQKPAISNHSSFVTPVRGMVLLCLLLPGVLLQLLCADPALASTAPRRTLLNRPKTAELAINVPSSNRSSTSTLQLIRSSSCFMFELDPARSVDVVLVAVITVFAT